MPAIYIHKYYKLAFQISACVNGQKDVFYKTNEDSNFPEKESGARFLSQTIIRFNSGNFGFKLLRRQNRRWEVSGSIGCDMGFIFSYFPCMKN